MKRFLFLIIILLISNTLYSFQFTGIQGEMGLMWIGNSDQSYGSVPSPVVPQLGVGPVFRINSSITYSPSIGFFRQEYRLTDFRKSVPTGKEYLDTAAVWTIKIKNPFFFNVFSGKRIRGAAGISPTFLFRFAGRRYGEPRADELIAYFYKKLRFTIPETLFALEWDLSDSIITAFNLGISWPLYSLWDSELDPFWDNMLINLSLLVTFPLK